ncbi:Protein of unknown function (DUF1538) [Mariprofundus ferrinatatus]|uniref:DUF1538 domain-containing protein n=1 Tax=Mariprofundus ferrinatatus TaxID=1921087 RepID=A0A2K8L5F2_9PROT|nr:DUF1538 domain-containing protein [Mariprofundus ferrinatatus]ATX81469.1 Protein of unknown function (DUF1538) [Mariprofundus ferrinatatus]
MSHISLFLETMQSTLRDVLPIAAVLLGFQLFVLRERIAHVWRVLRGFIYVLLGLALFLMGLEEAIFPLGEVMAAQLTNPVFLYGDGMPVADSVHWIDYAWVYVFAFAIGLATTLAEPSLIAVGMKAQQVSGGAISAWGLRLAVSLGVALGVSLGCYRIVTGTDLWIYIVTAYIVVIVQTMRAPKMIIPLAYDSGGVTTSTVTVPLLAALGLGLAATIPGRSPLIDGFGLIAFASVFPIMSVMGYAQISRWLEMRRQVTGGNDAL